MKIILMAQEEFVYFSPFFREIVKKRANEISLIVIAGNRLAGNHPKTALEKLKSFYSLWLLFEPKGFIRNLGLSLFYKMLSIFGLIGSKFDRRSLIGLAKQLSIPVFYTEDVNSDQTLDELKRHKPDVIINQSEMLLKKPLLSIPSLGVLNRHASYLPNFRGRVGSFWSHAQNPPEYGVTIHFVDEQIDSGPIVRQKRYFLNPTFSYTDVLDKLFEESVSLMIEALDQLKDPTFQPLSNHYQKKAPYKFPTLQQIKAYRKTLRKRRANSTISEK